jgi:hypothetical protein
MPKADSSYVPKYRYHKASGQARVEIEGQTFYLGPYKSKAPTPLMWIAVWRFRTFEI